MRAPAFPSSHYRAQGMLPVYWYGLVLWMPKSQYTAVKRSEMWGVQACDATEEQIASQDRWYESAEIEREREANEWARIVRLFASQPREEGQSGE